MFNLALGAAGYLLTLSKLGISVVGQKIFTDTVGDLVLRAGSPVVRFIKGIFVTLRNIFMGFLGMGTWGTSAMPVAA